MYYDIVKKMERYKAMEYDWEQVDGMPRYRWYKNALNSVHLIARCDEKFDIDNSDFSDLKYWYDSTEWVANNDNEALKYIFAELTPPVTQIVKDKYIDCLSNLGYYKSCEMARKYIRAYPVPKERSFKRKKEKATSQLEKYIIAELKGADQMLVEFKTKHSDKLYDLNPEMRDAFSLLLNIEAHVYGDFLEDSLMNLEWMRLHAPDELIEMFSIEVSLEIKEQLLGLLSRNELFRLYNLLDKAIKVKSSPFYYEIPEYTRSRHDILGDFFDMDDD